MTTCQRCGRELTDPQSVELGMGPVCRGYDDYATAQHTDNYADNFVNESLNPDGLLLRHDEHGTWTNIPHVVTHHSPAGYEFGYGGSGPADLALNIVEILLQHLEYRGPRMPCFDGSCFELAYSLYQEFKCKFIASVPHAGCRIDYAILSAWVKDRIPEMNA